jgi:hypothetical protein
MRAAASIAVAVTIAALTCAPLAAQRADSTVVGSWSGTAPITVPWTVTRSLAIRLDIRDDGSVTGAIGDAQLVDGRIYTESRVVRALRLARQYAIEGQLSGCVIRAEGMYREHVRLSIDRTGETITGDLQTSGSYEGKPSDLKLTAKDFVLQRVPRAVASDRRPVRPVEAAFTAPATTPR